MLKQNSLEARLAKKDLRDLLLNARLARKAEKCPQEIIELTLVLKAKKVLLSSKEKGYVYIFELYYVKNVTFGLDLQSLFVRL